MYNHRWGMHAHKGFKTAQSCYENWTELKGNAVASPYYSPLDQVHNLTSSYRKWNW